MLLYFLRIMMIPLMCAYSPLYALDEPANDAPAVATSQHQAADDRVETSAKKINQIIITGNTMLAREAILNKIPYTVGEFFNPAKTSTLIRNLYSLGYFRQISIMGEDVSNELMNLHIIIQEKKKLSEVIFEGNKHLSEKEVKKKIDFSKIPAVDKEELKKYVDILKKLYLDKNYHFTKITPSLKEQGDMATLIFRIEEGRPSVVKQILFKGNTHISAKSLRNALYTREDWVLSFLDSAGSFHPDALEMDKYTIETMYKNQGFLAARVEHVDIDMDPTAHNFYLTFHIEEGPRYTIEEIKVNGNEILSEEQILHLIPVKEGELYSQAKMQKTVELLRTLWGQHGYIYADIEPSIQSDEEKHTVKISLHSELGNKVRLNNITIVGNTKSRDFVIRRQILLDEGDILTTQKMEFSKNRVELLGYFDKRDGVNWKINRLANDECDLDLILKEVKTGSASFQVRFNGNPDSYTDPTKALTASLGLSNRNLYGYGISFDLKADISRQEQSGEFNLISPWIYNLPVSGGTSLFASNVEYEDLKSVVQRIKERRIGGSVLGGFFMDFPRDAHMQLQVGAENLSYNQRPQASVGEAAARQEFQEILNRRFQQGTLGWATYIFSQDMRNHPIHPSRGHQWLMSMKFGYPTSASSGFFKFEGDASWYTPLIGEADLVLCLHGHVGLIATAGPVIPYRELFNVGGPATVRGFLFGQISPNFETNAIGATKAFWVNAELIFPIRPDFSMKGVVFYDGGAGWQTPDFNCIKDKSLIRNNDFHYRHSIGVGIRILSPTPIQVDWGFKLDRNKKVGESASEVHFTMIHNF